MMAVRAAHGLHTSPAPKSGSVRNSLRSDSGRFFIRFRLRRRVAIDGDPQVKSNGNGNGNGNGSGTSNGNGNGTSNGNGNGNGNGRCAALTQGPLRPQPSAILRQPHYRITTIPSRIATRSVSAAPAASASLLVLSTCRSPGATRSPNSIRQNDASC